MSDQSDVNAAQRDFWTSPAGQIWLDHQDQMDIALADMLDTLLAAANIQQGERVLDIGFGTGESILRLSQLVGPDGHVHGADISDIMLGYAQDRTAKTGANNVSLTLADAQTHAFEPQSFDRMVSRFGMMFFADPVDGFRNIAGALKPGGNMTFICWAGLDLNPWFGMATEAAGARFGPTAPADPYAPGPMAFRDPGRVLGMMDEAGLTPVNARRVTCQARLPGGVAEASEFLLKFGPVGRAIRDNNGTEEDIAAIQADLAARLTPYATPDGMIIPSGQIIYSAGVPG